LTSRQSSFGGIGAGGVILSLSEPEMAGSEAVGAGSLEDARAFFPPSFSFSLGIALAEGSEIEEDVLE